MKSRFQPFNFLSCCRVALKQAKIGCFSGFWRSDPVQSTQTRFKYRKLFQVRLISMVVLDLDELVREFYADHFDILWNHHSHELW